MVAVSIARADLTARERRGATARSRDAQAVLRMLALALVPEKASTERRRRGSAGWTGRRSGEADPETVWGTAFPPDEDIPAVVVQIDPFRCAVLRFSVFHSTLRIDFHGPIWLMTSVLKRPMTRSASALL